jgi:uncharacterized protein DUF3592
VNCFALGVAGPLVQVLLQIIGFAAITTWLFTRPQRSSYSSMLAFVLGVAGALVFVDGFRLGVLEESRTRYGRVVAGVVDDLRSSDGTAWRGSRLQASELSAYEGICRSLLTLSLDEWVVDYRYVCNGATGLCRNREYVTHDLWSRLQIGQSINVRQSSDEKRTARLDENPQRGLALVKVALSCALLVLAGFFSGQFTLFRRQKYIEVDGVVTSVERVQYGDEARWKIRFAYFDAQGNAQDSIDEVNDPSWKSGDDCRAVYSPRTPDLATLRPRLGSDPGLTPGLTPV